MLGKRLNFVKNVSLLFITSLMIVSCGGESTSNVDAKDTSPVEKTLPIAGVKDFDPETGDTIYHTIPNFRFTNQEGQEISREIMNNKINVVEFFFTSCPGICPLMTKQVARVQEAFKSDTAFGILSFTVDPETDSVATLKTYADDHNADPNRWNLLTGDKDRIYRLAQTGFMVTAIEGEINDTTHLPDFVHSDKLILIDTYGRIRGYYLGTEPSDVNTLIADIKKLKYEKH